MTYRAVQHGLSPFYQHYQSFHHALSTEANFFDFLLRLPTSAIFVERLTPTSTSLHHFAWAAIDYGISRDWMAVVDVSNGRYVMVSASGEGTFNAYAELTRDSEQRLTW